MKDRSPDDSGPNVVEFTLVLLLVAVVFVIALVLLGPSLREIIADLVGSLSPS